jgi:hypothetical protein
VSDLRLPRTIRLDPSDPFVFEAAAEPGEWAVTGSFLFWDADPAAMPPKRRAAFRAGFLGVSSFGFSTLVVVSPATPDERAGAIAALADKLMLHLGAPTREAAMAAAEEEIDFAASLCRHPEGTLVALHRTLEDGEIKEVYRTLRARDPAAPGADRLHVGAKAFIAVESDEEDIEEHVDLLGMMDAKK